jgi:hypothetical protein
MIVLPHKIKENAIYIVIMFILLNILLKIVFHKELFSNILKISFGIFWIFVIPGFCIMYYWADKLNFFQRFIIGTAVGSGIIGTLSYYLGLAGLNIKYHVITLPLLFSIIGITAATIKNKKK